MLIGDIRPILRCMTGPSSNGQLGQFLLARRSRLRPEDVGLQTYGERRRVSGLRREELAQLAGVSASYYTRLEQGQSENASPEVLEAIALALDLDDSERRHLHSLAGAGRRRPPARRSAPERVAATTRELLAALGDVPAVVFGRRHDVLAWNRLGHALFAGHLDVNSPDRPADRPNMAKLVFLDAHVREMYVHWPVKAKGVVGMLRLALGQHPDDAALHALVGELAAKSDVFASMWADYRVKAFDVPVYDMCHPLVGFLTVTQQALTLSGDGHRVVIATTEPGSPSQLALALLAQAVAPQQAARADGAVAGHPSLTDPPRPPVD